jgi:hypothetical protein
LDEFAVPVFWNDPVDEEGKPSSASKKRSSADQAALLPKKKTRDFFSIYQCERLSIADF